MGIEPFLERWIPSVEQALERYLTDVPEEPERLVAAMRHALLGGGKRLRPACVLIGAAASGGAEWEALPAACAVEMVHSYSLVHDDLPCMDDDDLRRGRPTVHKAFDEATAVLAGDALLTLAFQVLATDLPPEISSRAAATLARAAGPGGMVGGQMADLLAEGQPLEVERILSIDRRKTAAMFSAAFELGGLCGGAGPDQLRTLTRIGEICGIAFQIVDDLLDIQSTSEQLGKAAGKDHGRGKATLPEKIGPEKAFGQARDLTLQACNLAADLPSPGLIEALVQSMLGRSH
ncbi:MAG: farnesyl diphosphate synthase [Planctomycetota bacterium]